MQRIVRHIALMAALLLAVACSDDQHETVAPMPDGQGRLSFRIGAPETFATRAVTTPETFTTRAVTTPNTWREGSSGEREIKNYVILICQDNGVTDRLTVLQKLTGGALTEGSHDDGHFYPEQERIESGNMYTGTYNLVFYCLANFTSAMLTDAAVPAEGTTLTVSDFEGRAIHLSNSRTLPAGGIPMTGKLAATVTINQGETTTTDNDGKDLQLMLWRMLAKMEFHFISEADKPIEILGIEIDPLSNGTAGTRLLQSVDLSAATNWQHGQIGIVDNPSVTANGPWAVNDITAGEPPVENAIVTVPKKEGTTNGTADIAFYVNETDASYTALENQLSLRFKVRREGNVEEIRYGFTTPYVASDPANDGFNVICRNDWLTIPIHLTDWQFRIEALPFPPIAGFQARMVSSDALSITFNTGGYIVLQPRFRKSSDAEGVWRGLDDNDITLVLPDDVEADYTTATGSATAIDATTNTGITMAGDMDIFEQRFVRLPSGDIVGKLTNDDVYGEVTVTLRVQLEGFYYQFSYNIIKQK